MLELPLSRANFYGSKGVQAIEVVLYLDGFRVRTFDTGALTSFTSPLNYDSIRTKVLLDRKRF